MTKAMKWTVVLGIVCGCLSVVAQQQFSGGQAVSQSGTWTVGLSSGTAVKVTDGTNFLPTGDAAARTIHVTTDNATQAVTQSGTWTAGINAGTALIGQTYPYTSCGTTKFTKALQAMPTSSTAVASATTCLFLLTITNTNGSSVTVTVSDNQGTPVNLLNAATLTAGETRQYVNLGSFTSGIKMQASTTGVNYAAEGLQ